MRLGTIYLSLLLALVGCHDHDHGSEADKLGVGAECTNSDDCNDADHDTDGQQDQECLTQFAGGYCGIEGCMDDEGCPEGSACVAHTDGTNYCFRICDHKSECNANRGPDVEANCSANISLVGSYSGKACVPPSSG